MRAHFSAELLLGRYGVLTKGSVAAEGVPGGFGTLYKVLTALEDAGRCQRGYFVESLGGAQFAVASTVDRLRSHQDSVDPDQPRIPGRGVGRCRPGEPVRLGAAVADTFDVRGHRSPAGPQSGCARGARRWRAGVVPRTRRPFAAELLRPTRRRTAPPRAALADLVTDGRVAAILVERVDGVPVLEPAQSGDRAKVAAALADAGFVRTPRGWRLRRNRRACPRATPSGIPRANLRDGLVGQDADPLRRAGAAVRHSRPDRPHRRRGAQPWQAFVHPGRPGQHPLAPEDGRQLAGVHGRRVRESDHRVRIILEAGDIQAAGIDLGQLEILERADDMSVVAHLGPDLLGDRLGSRASSREPDG